MIKSLKKTANNLQQNIPGWHTGRKIVVIESDDWGSIRMPSKGAYDTLLSDGIRVDKCPYNKYDSLESVEDLEALFSILSRFKDKNGRHPVITANTNVANPDFEKIKRSGYKDYFYEPFTETLKNYYPGQDVFGLYKKGMSDRMFQPQLHAREHVNAGMWLGQIREGSQHLEKAFDLGMFGLSMVTSPEINTPYLATLIYRNDAEKEFVKELIADGAALFEKIFGFTSKSFIAPLYTWSPEQEAALSASGVKYLQGANSHKSYDHNTNKRSRSFHAMGTKNNLRQIYLNRNCAFEPSLSASLTTQNCLKEISSAFFWKKPAVICSHRVNFMGGIDPANRTANLKQLESLLQAIVKRWPDVEFMSSDELGQVIEN
ncbi:polysaccharide (de)acetylase [uncultured Flavobacterium sp.]|uniref:polysaccharide (de)acetylase n=1 Tax=uncultured Flavobacterium sp. TaxID=165435 RepID=UPI0025F7E2C3|nr:polysaccharide (de)acetylase [uncultured Flavobacterium sp.]